ncbi:hypothetical protein PSQ19_09330 [Devosia algicola]|uniref:Uncharacterized protein n=1 Tax=Devosia algicola TaxID=3026418 RepID=A0ABY7YSR7_9HYPH|nr:hypothetical protein [Devosia algicola]WDR04168.1 hypothetical protein PSQ19_09330 [Devosia algicola]
MSDLDFQAAGTRLTGTLTRGSDGLTNGSLKLMAPDVSVAAALLLAEAQGAINADITLVGADGQQNANVVANAKELVFNDIRVGSADISAQLSDLLGVPVINGSAKAQSVSAAGVDVDQAQCNSDPDRHYNRI